MNTDLPEDVCPRPDFLPPQLTQPLAPAIYPAAVYRCESPAQAAALLAGEMPGYVYSRDGHPNGDQLAEKCRELHAADEAMIFGSGMGALAAALLAVAGAGDRIVASRYLYGRSLTLLEKEFARLGGQTITVDTCDLAAVEAACTGGVKLLVVETISNPILRVADIAALADIVHRHGGLLLVDNTFAGPTVCRPLALGADFVLESLTKIMNGHSDVLLGLLCGTRRVWSRMALVASAWGFSASPFDCWLALRGLGTLALRADRANANAQLVASFLRTQPQVVRVDFPGLVDHPDYALCRRQFTRDQYGAMVTMTLAGDAAIAARFIAACPAIPFCPSLGDLSTTLSHPASTSHRGQSDEALAALGITGATLRLSIGIESTEAILAAIQKALTVVT